MPLPNVIRLYALPGFPHNPMHRPPFSEPDVHARHPLRIDDTLADSACESRGRTEALPTLDADVWREPARDFVAQANAELDV